jgi:hypothetical protein
MHAAYIKECVHAAIACEELNHNTLPCLHFQFHFLDCTLLVPYPLVVIYHTGVARPVRAEMPICQQANTLQVVALGLQHMS